MNTFDIGAFMDAIEQMERKNVQMREALKQAETVMMIVEPRSHKAEYLEALEAVRSALSPTQDTPPPPTARAPDMLRRIDCCCTNVAKSKSTTLGL